MFANHPRSISLAVSLAGVFAGCSEPVPPGDVRNIDAASHVRVLLVDRPAPGCDRVELHLTVGSGTQSFATLAASAFEFSFLDSEGGGPRVVPNECFEAVTADGGAFFYRACFTGLAVDTPYFLAMRVTTPAGQVDESTYFRTLSCGDGGADARLDTGIDSGNDGGAADAMDASSAD